LQWTVHFRQKLFNKILKSQVRLPSSLSPNARSLIAQLLDRENTSRLGSVRDAEEIKAHPFFRHVDWAKVQRKEYKPEFVPQSHPLDAAGNFDKEFTSLSISPDDAFRAKFMSQNSAPGSANLRANEFVGFTFTGSRSDFSFQQ